MNRRQFVAGSVAAAAGAALAGEGIYAAAPSAIEQLSSSAPGTISESVIKHARFPDSHWRRERRTVL
jgi:hypothetical protein